MDRGSARGGIMGGAVDGPARLDAHYPPAEAVPGTGIAHRSSGFCGKLVALEGEVVIVTGATGLEKRWRNTPGAFLVDGVAVRLVPPAAAPAGPAHLAAARVSDHQRTASGSRAVLGARARVALPSRILVEGIHDAELVEKIWGDDLRLEGVVVERLDGADHLAAVVDEFDPGPGRRLGILLDHLVAGSKESHLAAAVLSAHGSSPGGSSRVGGDPTPPTAAASSSHPHVLVRGTPYVDVWQAIRPAVLGIPAWPVIPRGQPWKEGACAALGAGGTDPGLVWKRLLGAVRSWRDLEASFVGAVEELIDFVTATP